MMEGGSDSGNSGSGVDGFGKADLASTFLHCAHKAKVSDFRWKK